LRRRIPRLREKTGGVVTQVEEVAFRKEASRARERFAKLLLERVRDSLGTDTHKDREWAAFLDYGLLDYVCDSSPPLRKYFSEYLQEGEGSPAAD